MSIFPLDLQRWNAEGISPTTVGQTLRDAGVGVAALDPFTRWVPEWIPPATMSSDDLAFVDFNEAIIFAYAEAIGAEAINCVEPFGQKHNEHALSDALAGFSERAAARGFRTALEFMPISGIPDLSTALRVIDQNGPASLGFVFDIWHFVRSRSSLADLQLLDGKRIFEIQLADGRDPMTGTDLYDDLLHHRLLPGEGDFPIAAIMVALAEIGAVGSIGPEIFSDAIDLVDARGVGRRAGAATDQWSMT